MKNKKIKNHWEMALVQETSTIKDAIANLDLSGLQIALVVEKNNKLIGSITDGDIRRKLLSVQKSLAAFFY